MDPKTRMGPLAHARRIEAMEGFVADAEAKGAELRTGGKRIGNQGFFFEPTVLTDVPLDARIMNEEPFGPIAAINRFADEEEAIEEANRLPFGLAAYAYTRSAETQTKLAARVESGMISINHHGLALPEVPVRRREGFGLRQRGRRRGDRGLPQHEVRDAGGGVSASPARGRGQLAKRAGEGMPILPRFAGEGRARALLQPAACGRPAVPVGPFPWRGVSSRLLRHHRMTRIIVADDAHHRRRFPASSSGFCRVIVGPRQSQIGKCFT